LKLAEEHFDPLYYLGHTLSGDIISLRFKKDSTVKIEHRFTKSEALLSYRIAIYLDRNSYVTRVKRSFSISGLGGQRRFPLFKLIFGDYWIGFLGLL